MRIRFFNTFEPVSPFYRDLVPALVERGHEIEIFISQSEYRAGRVPLEQLLDHENVRIRRIPSGVKDPGSAAKKLWIILTYTVGTTLATLFGKQTDLNFFLTQPPLFQILGRVLKFFRRQPFTCLVMDLYPDVVVSNGWLKKTSLIARTLTWISRSNLRRAKNVVVIGRCMQDLLKRDGIEQTVLIPNWVNEGEVRRLNGAENPLRKKLGLGDKFVCLYSGNLGVSHRFDDLLEVMKQLKDHDEIRFVFIGEGRRRQQVESFSKEHDLTNVIMLPYQPTDRLAESLGLGQVHFVCLRNNFAGKVVPSKAYGAFAAGKPIIYQGDSKGEIARVVKEFGVGFVVDEGDVEGLKDAVLKSCTDVRLLAQQAENAYRISCEVFDRESSLNKYAALFEQE